MKYDDVMEQMTVQLRRGVPQVDIARAIGIDPRALNQRKKKNSKFADTELEQLERLFGVKFSEPISENDNKKKLKDIINEISAEKREKVTREQIGEVFGVSRQRITAMLNKPLPPHRLKQLEDAFCMTISDTAEQFGTEDFIKGVNDLKNDAPAGFKYLPIKGDISASCGNGVYVYDESQTAVYPVSEFLLKALGASIAETDIIFASGDSMLPEIKDGDALMVDKSKKDIIDGQIYIIRSDGQLLCKRLQKLPPQQIKVVSDNPKYDPYYIDFSKVIDFDFEVVGRVLWYSRIAR